MQKLDGEALGYCLDILGHLQTYNAFEFVLYQKFVLRLRLAIFKNLDHNLDSSSYLRTLECAHSITMICGNKALWIEGMDRAIKLKFR